MNGADRRKAGDLAQRANLVKFRWLCCHTRDELADTVAHFTRSLVGKRQRKDAFRRDVSLADEPGDSANERAGLACSRPGDYKRRCGRLGRRALLGVEWRGS